jgi:hypothetical protein
MDSVINMDFASTTATLSVSRRGRLDCFEMATYLSSCGIKTLITSNVSTRPEIEHGCQLTQTVESKSDIVAIWNRLRDRYGFKCGWLKIESNGGGNAYGGCILKFLKTR